LATRAEPIAAGALVVVSDSAAVGRSSGAGCVVEGWVSSLGSLPSEVGLDEAAPAAEVLARAYAMRGESMLDEVRGAFVLAAWADDGERVLLAQDQVAARALFLHRDGAELAFASEVRDLLPVLKRRPAPDEVSVARWLNLAWLQPGKTLYAGVERLSAGHLLRSRGAGLERHRYWAPAYRPPLEASRLEIAKELQEAIVRSVGARIADARRPGLMLSGGFDSATVAAAAGAALADGDRAIRGYSAVFPDDPEMDETAELDALHTALPVENVRYHVKPGGVLALSLAWVDRWALPISGSGYAVERALTRRAAADGVDIMLDGQGGDEIFGYSIYLLADYVRRGRLVAAVDLARHGFPGSHPGASWRFVRTFLKDYGVRGNLPHPLYRALRRLRSQDDQAFEWLSERSARLYFDSIDDLAWARDNPGRPRWWAQLATTLLEDREASGLGDYVRQRAEWVGLEARPPLFDVDLIELTLRIPPELTFDSYLDRPLAREAMAGLLPDEVRLSRRKSNLAPLHLRTFNGPDLEPVRRLLADDSCEVFAYTRRDVVRRYLDNPRGFDAGDWGDWLNLVFLAGSVEAWLRSQDDPEFPRRFLEAEGLREPEVDDISP
jgi:asparagine synthase (glutamine-hydrolysing)